jgi:hypothetical protein
MWGEATRPYCADTMSLLHFSAAATRSACRRACPEPVEGPALSLSKGPPLRPAEKWPSARALYGYVVGLGDPRDRLASIGRPCSSNAGDDSCADDDRWRYGAILVSSLSARLRGRPFDRLRAGPSIDLEVPPARLSGGSFDSLPQRSASTSLSSTLPRRDASRTLRFEVDLPANQLGPGSRQRA